VLLQFLFEALALTSAGAVLGLVLGVAATVGVGKFTASPAELSWEPIVLGVVLSWVVGLVFGLLPARRASRLHPVEALR
jgi:putative ABC transport system permease protein